MAKKILRISDEDKFDFSLIGIICHHRDYRLCRELNNKLEINLSKKDEYTVFNNKRMEDQFFSFYEFINEEGVMRPKDMRNSGDIGQIAADQRKRRLNAKELGKSGFQIVVQGPLPADEAVRAVRSSQ